VRGAYAFLIRGENLNNARKLTEGAILLATFIVLLLTTIYLPVIGAFLNLALPIPFILFAAKNDWKSTVVFVTASMLISFITGAILTFPLVIPYAITGAAMGYFIQKNKSRTTILIACSLIFLINMIALYAVTVAFFHYNYIDEITKIMHNSLSQTSDLMKNLDPKQQAQAQQTIKKIKLTMDTFKRIVPSLFVLMSLSYVFVIQLVSLPVLKRSGINVGNWKPFREISLPKSLLWYYLIVVIAERVVHLPAGSYWSDALLNLSYILQILMLFQGLTFIYFYFHQRNASKSFPVLITVFMFLIPQLFFVIVIIGIMDLGFGLRKRTENIK
jgi:uncharacterized protein YybS (DUF2232 family)